MFLKAWKSHKKKQNLPQRLQRKYMNISTFKIALANFKAFMENEKQI